MCNVIIVCFLFKASVNTQTKHPHWNTSQLITKYDKNQTKQNMQLPQVNVEFEQR